MYCEFLPKGCECPRDECASEIVNPVPTSYLDNLANIAEYFFYGRNYMWDFYMMHYSDLKEHVKRTFMHCYGESPIKYTSEGKAARAAYIDSNINKIVKGVNFCCREGSAYRELKNRLIDAIECEEVPTFSVNETLIVIKNEMRENGYTQAEINDAMYGSDCAHVIARLLILSVEDASDLVTIKRCGVSPYFPELMIYETCEVAETARPLTS